jgi:hypothetical protein
MTEPPDIHGDGGQAIVSATTLLNRADWFQGEGTRTFSAFAK